MMFDTGSEKEITMGDDAEYEMERLEEERKLEAARGPRNIQEILDDVHARIANSSAAKKIEKKR